MAARTTISLPDDLKAEMDAAGAAVNWSAEAAKCFRVVLGRIASEREKKDMTDVIARLRASKIKSESKKQIDARELGREWARSVAEYDELERAADLSGSDCCSGEPLAPYGYGDYIAFDILGLDEEDQDGFRSDAFWELAGVNSDRIRMDDEFLMYFLEGAAEVYDLVKSSV